MATHGGKVQGRVYLAAVPSAMAEGDLPQRFKNIHDQSLRFTRNIELAWERQIKPELEGYNLGFEEVAAFSGSSAELAGKIRKLKRDRGNHWFTAIRGVVAPAVLLQRSAGELGNDTGIVAEKFARLALEIVRERGKALLNLALVGAGERLARDRVIESTVDIHWLECGEVCDLLQSPGDRTAIVAQRKFVSERNAALMPAPTFGPKLPTDAPRMYLIPEILRLLDSRW